MWKIVTWELIRYLRNKQFLIGIFVTPLIFILLGAVPGLIERLDRPKEQVFLVVDELGVLASLQEQLQGSGVRLEASAADESRLQAAVTEGEVDGYFVLERSFIEDAYLPIYMEKVKTPPTQLRNTLTALLQSMRMLEQQIDAALLEYVTVVPALVPTALSSQDENRGATMIMAIVFSVLLFILIISSGSMLLQSALQEKRDRMSEVLLSSVNPDTLMAGKIVAHFLLGVIQIGFWLAIGLPIAYFVLEIPLGDYIAPSMIPLVALFTLLGYLLYAALFVGIGATMEDLQSASNSQGMAIMLPALPFVVLGPVTNNPDGLIAQIATLFPITSPTITLLRIGLSTVPTWEIVAAAIILLVSTIVVIKVAAKIFRTGMLMYGKNASLQEIWRWLRHS